MKKVLFFGIYDKNYSRNRILMRGFNENGFEVVECHVDPKLRKGFSKYFKLLQEYNKIRSITFEHVIVAFPGHSVMWLAYLLFGRTVIFDAFVSLYNSNVEDRKKYSRYTLQSFRDFCLDWYSIQCARIVLLDTQSHINYFVKSFKIKKEKCVRVFVGADNHIFYPREQKPSAVFNVYFHGSFIPLQGIEYIIEAAHMLRNENIIFTIIGQGQEYLKIEQFVKDKQLENVVQLLGKKPLEELPVFMAHADVCLGIFGASDKTERVIPNKVFEAVAMRLPVITAQTDAILEIFKEEESMIFCRRNDSEDLAEKILWVKHNKDTAMRIAANAYELFNRKLLPKVLVKGLLENINTR